MDERKILQMERFQKEQGASAAKTESYYPAADNQKLWTKYKNNYQGTLKINKTRNIEEASKGKTWKSNS